jgi:hypothetical protein
MASKTAAKTKPEPIRATLVAKEEKQEAQEVRGLVVQESNPHTSLQLAIERGMSADTIEKLIGAAERWDVLEEKRRMRAAEATYVSAMASFKSNPPDIIKRSTALYNGKPQYNFVNVGDAVAAIIPALAECGFSHSWKHTKGEGNIICVRCVVTHKDAPGYSEHDDMEAPPDTSGNKNPLQAIASTRSYLEKYTLLSVLGLAAREADDDGRTGGGDPVETPEEKAARETREAEAKVAKEIADGWFDKLDACTTWDNLVRTKADMVAYYGGITDLVPADLQAHFIARRKVLKPKPADAQAS